MKIVHISPTYFDSSSIIGGGERYPTELALWMSKKTQTTLVSFSNEEKNYSIGSLQVQLLKPHGFFRGQKVNPCSLPPISQIASADIVHIHHFATLVSDLSALLGRFIGKRVYVTDYGGGASITLSRFFPTEKLYTNAIAYSDFGRKNLPPRLRDRAELILGGIDLERFKPPSSFQRKNKILCVGRILSHKGIHLVIQAFKKIARAGDELVVIGQPYNEEYFAELKKLAAGSSVQFIHGCSDEELIEHYQSAKANILASSYTGYFGESVRLPELMGFTLSEAQACGALAVCTRVGGMPEFVRHEQTGYVCRDQSIEDLAEAMKKILTMEHDSFTCMSQNARSWAESIGWNRVVDLHLSLYARK